MATLLEKTRKINRLLQKSEKVDYPEISRLLSDVLESNVYIANRNGTILGYSLVDGFECEIMMERVLQGGDFPERYVEWLMRITETSPNHILKNHEPLFQYPAAV